MIRNLKETTRINTEQDWLKTNLAKFSRLLQGQSDLYAVSRHDPVRARAARIDAAWRVLHQRARERRAGAEAVRKLRVPAPQASGERIPRRQGLVGQCLIEKQRILLTNVPGDYVVISSGLGEATPLNIVLLPIIFEDQVLAILELASFRRFSEIDIAFLDQLTESIGIVHQYDAGEPADGGAADAVPVADGGAAEAAEGAADRRTTSWRTRRSCSSFRKPKSRARTTRSSWPNGSWKRKPSSSR